ncbi:putative protease YoaZ [Vibrio zhanjiangensis]|uniref:Protease YoaZ n=1 Tax=Vibrio zhanjiangensis TaxID=1046128 RepID=A0ABQ6EU24_9VIBR|nr:DJ-1/PfpI family protein [Vibrio zhanjiangensis]GLT16657.1 putative protease YoaZ [Vibrio zhanjiangensis]
MKKMVYLAVYEGISDWEYGYVLAHINSPDFQANPNAYGIQTVGKSKHPIRTKGGVSILPDLELNELNPEDGAMFILCGSDHAATGGIDDFVRVAKQLLEQGVFIAAICGATAALAKHGLLNNIPHTSNAKEYLEMTGYAGGKYYVEKPAVSSEAIITASGIEPVAFAVEIFKKLNIYSDDVLDAWITLFEHKDIKGFYELMESGSK